MKRKHLKKIVKSLKIFDIFGDFAEVIGGTVFVLGVIAVVGLLFAGGLGVLLGSVLDFFGSGLVIGGVVALLFLFVIWALMD